MDDSKLGLRSVPMVAAVVAACGGEPSPPPDRPTSAPIPARSEATSPGSPAPSQPTNELPAVTPNELYARGLPTFIVGTTGGPEHDRDVAGQARFLATLLFPEASVIEDTAVDVAAGPSAWPANPVLYGGPAVHGVLAMLASQLPFEMTDDRLVIGGQAFEGPGIQLITVLPAQPADARGPGHPELLLYAGTGPLGVAEINAVAKGAEPIVVSDAFGILHTGRWVRDETGRVTARLDPARPRSEWRSTEHALPGFGGGGAAKVMFRFLRDEPEADDASVIEACRRGLARAIERLRIATPSSIVVYVHPDAERKAALTGKPGDGHAKPAAMALHVRVVDASVDGALERLVAHEGTHLLARAAWGAPGTPLMGEGIAVWVAGGYGGTDLSQWRERATRHPLEPLLGKQFLRMAEPETYPLAGLLVDAAVAQVGLDAVRDHLYGATAGSWDVACRAAGTTAEALARALAQPG
jgi:hypothetical protein